MQFHCVLSTRPSFQLTLVCVCLCIEVWDELKQREVGNAEKEDSARVKKQTIDLLPDAENNLAKLQVGEGGELGSLHALLCL